MTKINIENGHYLNVKTEGDNANPTIIFSNSLGSDLNMWEPQVNFFKNNFHIVRYDKRGHGLSSDIKGPYSFDILEEDVIKIMNDLNIEKSHFVGLSMGGMTSLGLGLKYADRFNKLICCAARADMPPPAIEAWDQRISIVKEKGTEALIEGSIERWFSEGFRFDDANKETLNKTSNMIKNTSDNGYIGSCEAIKGLNYLKDLSNLTKDFLYVAGESDIGAPALHMEEMHHLTPNSKYICIPQVAHVFNLENPEETNKIISDFLN